MKDLAQFARSLSKGAQDNSPVILTAVGVTGTCATAVLTARASFKSATDLQGTYPDLPWQEKVKLVWQNYIPPVAVGTLTIAAIIASNRVSTNRAVALAAAYSITEQTFETYKQKVVEKLGEAKEEEVRAEIAQEKLSKTGNPTIIIGTGKCLCYDEFSGRYFESSVEEIKKAQNDTNYQMLHEGYASLSDFYSRIGLETTSMSEELGWNSDKQLEVSITSTLTPDQRPAVSISFHISPARDYWKFR